MMNEIWQSVYDNLTLFVIVSFIIFVTIVVQKLVKKGFYKYINGDSDLKPDDSTNFRFLYYALVAVIYLTGLGFAIWNVPFLKHVAQSMLAGAGILAIVIGFASQQALANIVSGVFIVMFKPYRINDRVTVKDTLRGVVEDINLRHTVIRNFENQRIVIPNSIISNEVLINSNYIDDKLCRFINVGISYSSDIDLAKSIMADEVQKHPLNMDVRSEEDIENGVPRVSVRVIMLDQSSVNLRAWAWAEDAPNAFVMECDLLESIKKRFDREGIIIPFPQRTLSYVPGSAPENPNKSEISKS